MPGALLLSALHAWAPVSDTPTPVEIVHGVQLSHEDLAAVRRTALEPAFSIGTSDGWSWATDDRDVRIHVADDGHMRMTGQRRADIRHAWLLDDSLLVTADANALTVHAETAPGEPWVAGRLDVHELVGSDTSWKAEVWPVPDSSQVQILLRLDDTHGFLLTPFVADRGDTAPYRHEQAVTWRAARLVVADESLAPQARARPVRTRRSYHPGNKRWIYGGHLMASGALAAVDHGVVSDANGGFSALPELAVHGRFIWSALEVGLNYEPGMLYGELAFAPGGALALRRPIHGGFGAFYGSFVGYAGLGMLGHVNLGRVRLELRFGGLLPGSHPQFPDLTVSQLYAGGRALIAGVKTYVRLTSWAVGRSNLALEAYAGAESGPWAKFSGGAALRWQGTGTF